MSNAKAQVRKEGQGRSWGASNGWIGAILVLALLVLLALLGYSLLNKGSGDRASQATVLAPDFEFDVYQGAGLPPRERLRLSDLRGTPVVLNFWAGLCPPCRAEMPDFQEVSEAFGNDIIILGIDIGPFTPNAILGTREDAQNLLEELGITYPTGGAVSARPLAAYNIIGMPSTYFITAEGAVKQKWTGFLNRKRMDALVQELLQTS